MNDQWSARAMVWTRDHRNQPAAPQSYERFEIQIQDFTIKAIEPPLSTMVADMKSLVNNKKSYPDITFKVESEFICGHKSILVARSDYFRALFTQGMIESSQSVIEIKDTSSKLFLILLHFIYSDEITSILMKSDTQEVVDIWCIFSKYGLTRAEKICEAHIQMHCLNEDSVISLLHALEKAQLDGSLKKLCLQYASMHYGNISLNEEIKILSSKTISDITELQKARGKYFGSIN